MRYINILFINSALAFFFLFFLHGTSIGNGQQGISYNATIYATKNKTMKATAIGLWYVQIPNIFVVNPFGEVVTPKVYKGNKVIIDKRKQISVSKLPHLNYDDTMNFKKVFC